MRTAIVVAVCLGLLPALAGAQDESAKKIEHRNYDVGALANYFEDDPLHLKFKIIGIRISLEILFQLYVEFINLIPFSCNLYHKFSSDSNMSILSAKSIGSSLLAKRPTLSFLITSESQLPISLETMGSPQDMYNKDFCDMPIFHVMSS